jgi:hypothetical protein
MNKQQFIAVLKRFFINKAKEIVIEGGKIVGILLAGLFFTLIASVCAILIVIPFGILWTLINDSLYQILLASPLTVLDSLFSYAIVGWIVIGIILILILFCTWIRANWKQAKSEVGV